MKSLIVCLLLALWGLSMLPSMAASRAAGETAKRPIRVALSAEYGVRFSLTANSIERGIRLAIAEINGAGGLLDGRPLELVVRDDRGVPGRGVDNLREMAADPDVVAVFGGRFSPVLLDMVPVANALGIPLLDPWAAADRIVTNAVSPDYVFRLSLTDGWAVRCMLRDAAQRGFHRLAVFLPNTAWGRSNEEALRQELGRYPGITYAPIGYNWGDEDFSVPVAQARASAADALLLVANDAEGALILRQLAIAPTPPLPVIAHWGITGGDFPQRLALGPDLGGIDLRIVQSFTFEDPASGEVRQQRQRVMKAYRAHFHDDPRDLMAQVGFAHAYDFTQLLARAITTAGSTDRAAVRQALEALGDYTGVVRHYHRPFAPRDHEALDEGAAFMTRFDRAGRMHRLEAAR